MQPFTIINEDSSSIELLFCQYHHLIVMGGHFKAKIINEEVNLLGEKTPWNFELIGPFKEVEIAEQVIGAREMIKLESDNKVLKS